MGSPPDQTFFLDRCLGKNIVADALRGAGVKVELHDTHFPQDCNDDVWIRAVTERGWVILTKDRLVKRRAGHREALESAGAAAFILTSADARASDNASAFLAALHRICRLTAKYTRPLIATVSPSGHVTVVEGVRRGGVRK